MGDFEFHFVGQALNFEGDAILSAVDDAAAMEAPMNSSVLASIVKRTIDILIALLILLFVLPILLVAAVFILADSKGPVLFVQRRTGFGGQPFGLYKLRSMSVMEDGGTLLHTVKGDQRVTRVGRFLRRSSIDELPQLLNVLKGDMSLVGPRPHALAHDRYYGALVPSYSQRFRVKPGITGLAQVNGLRGEIHNLDGMVQRIAQDNAYIENWSLQLDLKILAKTANVVSLQTNAY